MSTHYFLTWKEVAGPESIAMADEKTPKAGHELIPELEGKNIMPFNFVMKKIVSGKKGIMITDDLSGLKNVWDDYQGNEFSYPMMSKQMKEIIEAHLTGQEGIDWIACRVKGPEEERPYYILRFNKKLDVLDMDKTKFGSDGPPDDVMFPCFSLKKIKNYSVFAKPKEFDHWKISPGIYVSASIKKAIQKAKLIGVKFNPTWVA